MGQNKLKKQTKICIRSHWYVVGILPKLEEPLEKHADTAVVNLLHPTSIKRKKNLKTFKKLKLFKPIQKYQLVHATKAVPSNFSGTTQASSVKGLIGFS